VVAFDATPLEMARPAGIGRYTAELLAALLRHPACPELALVAARALPASVLRGTLTQHGPRLPNRTLWMQCVLPMTLRRLRPNVCHFTNSVAPLFIDRPYVVTVHDMALYLYARTQTARHLVAARSILPRTARRASAVVTVSESARRDIVEVLQLPPERVRVVYQAAGSQFRVVTDDQALDRVRRRYALSRPFVLFVGTIEPRKNLRRLFEAFARLASDHPDLQLVIAGQLGWKYAGILRHLERLGLSSSVRRIGYADDADLPALYNLARLVALPSLYEGFGLPILEAMASGVPVVTSARASMEEIGGDAAILVDPESVESIETGLRRGLEDEPLRERLRASGLSRAAGFSWEGTADRMVRLYEEVGS
jgi:glycosyltransferase involved in cell wall biosynthesis